MKIVKKLGGIFPENGSRVALISPAVASRKKWAEKLKSVVAEGLVQTRSASCTHRHVTIPAAEALSLGIPYVALTYLPADLV